VPWSAPGVGEGCHPSRGGRDGDGFRSHSAGWRRALLRMFHVKRAQRRRSGGCSNCGTGLAGESGVNRHGFRDGRARKGRVDDPQFLSGRLNGEWDE
jgi:hypothetical protein